MKETSFGINNKNHESNEASSNEEIIRDLKNKIEELADGVSQHSPETEEFLALKESFINIQPQVEEQILKYINREEESDFRFSIDRQYVKYFELIDKLDLLTDSNKEMALRLYNLSYHLDHTIADEILRKRSLYTANEKDINQEDHLAAYILKNQNFSEEEVYDLIQSWLSVEDDEMASSYISENLNKIRGLEEFEKKSAKYLYNNFGIRGFGRYRIHELKKQYNERDNMAPYGLFLQAVTDWNGSFSQSNQSEDLREKVEENSFNLRIIEAKGKIDLAKRLLFLRDKYKQKIKFMFMHVHGNTDVIGLGDREGSDRKFLQEDLKGKGVQRLKELFENDAELILSSCLTGVSGGLAEEMANVYQLKVIAADKATMGEAKFMEINKNPSGTNLNFNIEFNTVDEKSPDDYKEVKGTVIYKPKL